MSSINFETGDLSRADIDRLIARGRLLQSRAIRDSLSRAYRSLIGGCNLRSLRLAGQRQPCC